MLEIINKFNSEVRNGVEINIVLDEEINITKPHEFMIMGYLFSMFINLCSFAFIKYDFVK